MRPRRFLVTALVTVLAAGVVTAVAVGSRGHRQVGPPASQTRLNCPAPALGGTLPTLVYLPRDYQPKGRPLPVIYFMHGLPADPTTYTQYSFVANALDGASQRAIVVAFQGARSANDDQEYLDWSPTDDWPKAISQQLVTCIDSHFDAMRSRRGRALVGLSAGGYGAMNIGLRNLRTYSVVEAWSGYFAATNPSGLSELNFDTPIESAAARVLRGPQLKAALGHDPSTLIGFYVGRSDARFYDANVLFSRTLTADHIPHVFRTYPGGHTPSLWEEHAKGWMRMAVAYLARRRVVAP